MTSYIKSLLFIICCVTGIAWIPDVEQTYGFSNGIITLSGSTSFDNWDMSSNAMESTGSFSLANGKLVVVNPFHFSMRVKSLTSSNQIRDKSIYKFLKSYPNDKIYFKHSYTETRPAGKDRYQLKITGNIDIAGVTQIMVINLQCTAYPDSLIRMSGTTFLKMSKFQVYPKHLPRSSTYNDNVKVVFDLGFKPSRIL